MVSITTNNTFQLHDGRTLGYADFGDPQGTPVLFFHGTPGSRHSGLIAGIVAGPMGARVIALDRPGYGLSTFQRDRRIADWPADVVELADHLNLDRFALLAFSGGAAFAAACALHIPQRLTHVGIVSGMGPLDLPGVTRSFRRTQRLRFWAARRSSTFVRLAVWLATRRIHRQPERFFTAWSASVSNADRAILARPSVRAVILDDRTEAFRSGSRGAAWEIALLANSWGVPLDQITCPIHLWHGEADTVVPLALAQAFTEAIPTSTSRFYPGQGHLLLVDEMEDILRTLIA